jgi:hypothetical protein
MSTRFQRAFLRAPLKTFSLYQDDDYVLKARLINISEGGVLIENLPHIPEVPAIPLVLDLPHVPDLLSMPSNQILHIKTSELDRDIIRIKARIARQFEAESEVDKLFVKKIGCEFVKADEDERDKIREYVARFTRNIVYLLNQFESSNKNLSVLRKTAEILGYDGEERVSFLRQKVLHDYQSLESL